MENMFVEKLKSLSELGEDEVCAIQALTRMGRRYAPRKDIIREGDRPGPVFVMQDGWACRYKILPSGSRQIMAFMIPGDSCDLNANMLAEMDHGIQAITATKVAMISASDMRDMMERYPRIAKAMYISQLADEGTLRAWITSMGRRSSIERVAHLVCELYIRVRNIGREAEGRFELPISQIVLADALGMTPVHINRVLKQLREMGTMALGRGRVEILDPDKLARFAGFDENYLHRRLRDRHKPPR